MGVSSRGRLCQLTIANWPFDFSAVPQLSQAGAVRNAMKGIRHENKVRWPR